MKSISPIWKVSGLAPALFVATTLVLTMCAFVGVQPAAATVSASYPTVTFSSGFDSGNLSGWTMHDGTGQDSVIAGAAYSGADGLRLGNGANQYSMEEKQLSAPLTDSSTSFWVRINSAGSGYSGKNIEDIAEARDNSDSVDVWQLIYDSSRQGLWFFPAQGSTEQAIFTGSGTVPLGSWNHIEVRYDASSSGGAELLINGNTQPSWNLSGNYSRTDNLQRIELWNDAATTTDFDSVLVATPGAAAQAVAAPGNTAAPVVSGVAQQGQVLSSSAGSWSNSPSSYSFGWEDCDSSGANCVAIGGATGSSYTLGAGDVGHTIRSVVTASNAGGSSAPASSAQTAVVTAPPAAPSNSGLPVVSGTAQQGQVLSTTKGSWTGSPTSYSYKWQDCDSSGANCAAIGGATGSSYTLGAGDVGHTIRSVVTATNAGGSTPASSAQTAVVTAAAVPQNSGLPVVSGTAQQAQALSTTNGTWSNSPTSYSYGWEDCDSSGANCVAISGASASTYTLTASDVGHTIRSVVTASNAGGSSTPASSAQTAVVTASSGGGGGGTGGVVLGFDVATDLATSTPWSDLTQDNLFTLQTTAGSGLDTAGQGLNQMNVPQWVSTVHANGKQALITIGGIADQNWQTACNNTYRSAFVTNLVNYMKTNGFDGIDLDIEDNNWASQNPPVAAWDTCVQAIATAAHATTTAAGKRPIVSEDVTTPWMGPYVADDVSYLDQFNLMTYGETTSQVNSDVATTAADGVPKSKMVIGIDLVDNGQPSGGCGQYGADAQQQGLDGVMVWDIHSDQHNGTFPCFTGLAPYAG